MEFFAKILTHKELYQVQFSSQKNSKQPFPKTHKQVLKQFSELKISTKPLNTNTLLSLLPVFSL